MCDVVDSRLYKRQLETEDGEVFKCKEAFSLLLNTDGISIGERSKITVWTVYLEVNEIQVQQDFV